MLDGIFNKTLKEKQIPQGWEESQIVPIFTHKQDPLGCANYREIQLLEHSGESAHSRILPSKKGRSERAVRVSITA